MCCGDVELEFSDTEVNDSDFWEIVDEFGGGDPLSMDGVDVEVASFLSLDVRNEYSDGVWAIRPVERTNEESDSSEKESSESGVFDTVRSIL